MITYILNFILCSTLFLAVYHLLLKNKALFSFNRFYLLAVLMLSALLPAISIDHTPMLKTTSALIVPVQEQVKTNIQTVSSHVVDAGRAVLPIAKHQANIYLIIYCIITVVLLLRFARNVLIMIRAIRNNERINFKGATIVLIERDLTPHTFLRYIFLNKEKYRSQQIEPEILIHELAHAKQGHSIDIIFIELMLAFYWIAAPLLMLYRKALQMNHEYLADAAALSTNDNVAGYQQLILNHINQNKSLNLTSQFNYSTTKNRFIMMTKKHSTATALICKLALIPVIAIAIMAFCNKSNAVLKTTANTVSDPVAAKYLVSEKDGWFLAYPSTARGLSAQAMKAYMDIVAKYKNNVNGQDTVNENINPTDRLKLETLFKQMNREQQVKVNFHFIFYPERYPRVTPTMADIAHLQASNDYNIYIDGKKTDKKALETHHNTDFASIWVKDRDQKSNELTDMFSGFNKNRYAAYLLTRSYYTEFATKHSESDLSYAIYDHGDSSKVTIHDTFYLHR